MKQKYKQGFYFWWKWFSWLHAGFQKTMTGWQVEENRSWQHMLVSQTFSNTLCHTEHFHTICAPAAKGCSVPGRTFCLCRVTGSREQVYNTCLRLDVCRVSAPPVNPLCVPDCPQPARSSTAQQTGREESDFFLFNAALAGWIYETKMGGRGRGNAMQRQARASLALTMEIPCTLGKVKIFFSIFSSTSFKKEAL